MIKTERSLVQPRMVPCFVGSTTDCDCYNALFHSYAGRAANLKPETSYCLAGLEAVSFHQAKSQIRKSESPGRSQVEDVQVVAMLVRRCIAGDAAAWEEIVQTYNRRIYNICYRFAGSGDDAQDLTQEVFIKMYRTLPSYDPGKGRVRDMGDDHHAKPAGGPFPQDETGPDDRLHGHDCVGPRGRPAAQ